MGTNEVYSVLVIYLIKDLFEFINFNKFTQLIMYMFYNKLINKNMIFCKKNSGGEYYKKNN